MHQQASSSLHYSPQSHRQTILRLLTSECSISESRQRILQWLDRWNFHSYPTSQRIRRRLLRSRRQALQGLLGSQCQIRRVQGWLLHVMDEHQTKKNLEILGLEVVPMRRMGLLGLLQHQLQRKSLDLDQLTTTFKLRSHLSHSVLLLMIRIFIFLIHIDSYL